MNMSYIKYKLYSSGYKVCEENRMKNNVGNVLRLENGCIVNCYDTGKITYQGKNTEEVKLLLETSNNDVEKNRKVFVVYGHDKDAKTQLEAMLRRWNVEPIIIDQLESGGNTVIEKLESYMSEVNFGIVLATPDDIGYAKGHENEKKFRVRQNVVLELGMLLASLGRSKVAILLKNAEEMEKPSDIHGLIYFAFSTDVEEQKVMLAKEMNQNGYDIHVSSL